MIRQLLKPDTFIHNIFANNLKYNYVIRYTPRRSAFDKTSFNEEWLPRQKVYHKSRKPRQA